MNYVIFKKIIKIVLKIFAFLVSGGGILGQNQIRRQNFDFYWVQQSRPACCERGYKLSFYEKNNLLTITFCNAPILLFN